VSATTRMTELLLLVGDSPVKVLLVLQVRVAMQFIMMKTSTRMTCVVRAVVASRLLIKTAASDFNQSVTASANYALKEVRVTLPTVRIASNAKPINSSLRLAPFLNLNVKNALLVP
jgi:polyisoprenoid-binding protein YceI